MPGWITRTLIAVLAVVFIYWVLPPLAQILGFPLTGPVIVIIHACVAVGAVFYIVFGKVPA
jgi:hypothetical protein